MAMRAKVIGPISAYAIAVSKGYTGTEEEFAQQIADAANNAAAAEAAAEHCDDVLESIPLDYSALSDEVETIQNAIGDLEEGSLSALGATNGQFPTADGEGSWEWETPNFIRATDDQSNEIVIPEIDDSTTSAYDVWSSQKTSAEIGGKYAKPANGIPASDLADGVVTTTETVSGTTPEITGMANHRYICGEVSTISITPPASGEIDVIFDSGATAAVLTLPQGNTLIWPSWFNPSALQANATYEINILNAKYGAVGIWTA